MTLTPERSDLVHICKCSSCVFNIERVAAKCFVGKDMSYCARMAVECHVILPQTENCNDTTIKFTERLIAGTLVSVEK